MRATTVILAALTLLAAGAKAASPAPQIHGASAIVVDVQTGRVLFNKNSREQRAVASTQKLLTALLVAEAGDLDAPVTIKSEDTTAPPTKLYLKAGQVYTRRELMQALLLRSANDVARSLARDNAGSVEAFAEKMNHRARSMGATSSNFINPNGLPAQGQYSTARDMAIIARNAYANPVVRDMVATRKAEFHFSDGRVREMVNTNRVLHSSSFCNGMKTGYTDAAGHCLVASGQANGKDVITVILGSNKAKVWDDSRKLLQWGLQL
jgi:serine-type D-Ala-D-Ala carboxypeptidase (penicillin-binding protein 5/6)